MPTPLTPNSGKSTDSVPPQWIDRMFQRFAGMYGKHWLDMWVGIDLAGVKQVWSEELAGLSPQEIAAGMEACKTRTFPPTLPEFRSLCRPVLDLHALLLVAIREMGHRRNHQPQAWPSRRLFWAAQRLAHELRSVEQPEKLLKRFELAWYDAAHDADKPIPDVAPASALPAPGKTTLSKQDARQRAEQIGLRMGQGNSARQWALDIANDPQRFSAASIQAALNALDGWGIALTQALNERASALGLIAATPSASGKEPRP